MICNKKVPSTVSSKRVRCVHYIPYTNPDTPGIAFCRRRDEFLCIEDLEHDTPRLSYSTVADFLRCRRLYFIKHIKGVTLKKAYLSPAVKMGSLWDAAVPALINPTPDIYKNMQQVIDDYEIADRDIVKVKSLFRAAKQLDIQFDPFCQYQYRFEVPMAYENTTRKYILSGVFDRRYADHLVEVKATSRPDFYSNIYNITPQVGTYFLADEDMQYVVMEIVRIPDLKSAGQYKNETDAEYEERCLNDIIARPAHYFIGFDKEARVFGRHRTFYRKEFPLQEIYKRYSDVWFEIQECALRDAFYKNWTSCYSPFVCDYVTVCLHNTISEEMYDIKPKPEEKVEDLDQKNSLDNLD